MSSKNKKRSVSPSDKGEGAAPNVPVVDGSGSPPPPPPPPTPTDSGKSGGSKGDNGKSGSKSPFGDLWGGAKKFLSSVLSPIPIATAVANSTREWLQGPRTNGPQGSRANGPHDPRANELRDTRRNLDVAELNQKRSDILGNDINDRVKRYITDGVLDRRDDWLSSMVPGSKSFRDTKAARVLDSVIDQGSYEKRKIELQRAFLAGKGDPTLARGSSTRAEAVRQANSAAYWERRSAMRARDQAYWDHWKQQNAERRAAEAAQPKAEKPNPLDYEIWGYRNLIWRTPTKAQREKIGSLTPPDKGSETEKAPGASEAPVSANAPSAAENPLAVRGSDAPPPPPAPSEDDVEKKTHQAYGGGETFGTYRVNSDGRHSRQGLPVDKLALLRASFGYA